MTRSAAGLNTSSTNLPRPSPDHSASQCILAALRDRGLAPSSEETLIVADAYPSIWMDRLLAGYVNRLTKARAVSATSRQPLSMVRA